jgi:membrane peptidoglycan carboxypeptidase
VQRPTLFQSLALLTAVSVVAGIIMAGMLLPFVGGGGLIARHTANEFNNDPSDFKAPPAAQASTLVTASGKTFATFYSQDRVNVPLTQIPLVMQQAIIDIEDHSFYEHGALDFKGTLRALLTNGASGSVTQGGSTLTQQYVKNVLVDEAHTKKQRADAIEDTFARKFKEAKDAIQVAHQFSKAEILDRYLNIAYFGDGAYGVGTAAEHFFHEDVSALTLPQSALLAGLVQSPEAYNPRYYPTLAKQRRDTVLSQMQKYGAINQSQYSQALASPITLHIHNDPNDCVVSKDPYFCDYVKHVFENTPGLGLELLRRGGLTVTTTLSSKVEHAANKGIHQYVHSRDPSGVDSAEAVVQPGTGQIKALAVNQPYGLNSKKGENAIDYAVDAKYGGSPYGFHAGSTFKLFVLAAALKQGIPLGTSIHAPPTITIPAYTTCTDAIAGPYDVHNAGDSEAGTFNLESGTWFSVNTFYAQLEKKTGLCQPIKLAEQMGVHPSGGGAIPPYPSFVLGSAAGFTPLDVAGAYATMAAHGKYCSPIAITKITDATGKSYPVPKSQCTQVVQPGIANTITSILQGVLTHGGATGTADALTGRPAAAKTGTVDNYDGSWFAGYTPQLAAAVWAGFPKSPNESLAYKTIGGVGYGEVFGATLAGKIWQATLNSALAGRPVDQFTGASNYYEIPISSTVPNVTGDSPSDAEASLQGDGFDPVLSHQTVDSTEKAGTVARTSPGGGASASSGTTVVIYLSNGKAPSPKKSATNNPSNKPSTKPSKSPGIPVTTVSPNPPQQTPPAHKHHH